MLLLDADLLRPYAHEARCRKVVGRPLARKRGHLDGDPVRARERRVPCARPRSGAPPYRAHAERDRARGLRCRNCSPSRCRARRLGTHRFPDWALWHLAGRSRSGCGRRRGDRQPARVHTGARIAGRGVADERRRPGHAAAARMDGRARIGHRRRLRFRKPGKRGRTHQDRAGRVRQLPQTFAAACIDNVAASPRRMYGLHHPHRPTGMQASHGARIDGSATVAQRLIPTPGPARSCMQRMRHDPYPDQRPRR